MRACVRAMILRTLLVSWHSQSKSSCCGCSWLTEFSLSPDLLAAGLSAAGSKQHPRGTNYVYQLRRVSKRRGTSKQMLQQRLSRNDSQLLLQEKVILMGWCWHHTFGLRTLLQWSVHRRTAGTRQKAVIKDMRLTMEREETEVEEEENKTK